MDENNRSEIERSEQEQLDFNKIVKERLDLDRALKEEALEISGDREASYFDFYTSEDDNKKDERKIIHYNFRKFVNIKYFFILVAVLFVIVCTMLLNLRISKVEISGNVRYSEQQIEELLFPEKKDRSSIILFIKNKLNRHRKIPFIDYYSIDFKSPVSIKVDVFEKAVFACVEYKSTYIYFDKNAVVIESSQNLYEGVPLIRGVKVDGIALYKSLFDVKSEVFNRILNFTDLIKSDNIEVDTIDMSDPNNTVLRSDDIKINMGNSSYLGEKIDLLRDILPKIKGLKGILYLDNYTPGNEKYIFKKIEN